MKLTVALALLLISCGSHPPHATGDRIVVLGDSVARGAGDETARGIEGPLGDLLHRTVVNCGINGARTTDVLRAMAAFPLEPASAIVISIGGNDLYGDTWARIASTLWPQRAMVRTADNIAAIVRRIHHRNGSAAIILLGLYDPYANAGLDRAVNRWDSLLIARFANDPGVTVIRIADLMKRASRISAIDHFHPSASGYALIAARIAPSL